MNFNQIKNSEFVKNVITMLSGTTAGQFIAFLMLPVVARLYTPVQFGEYSLFISIASVIAVMASGRYELSIVLIKKDINAFNLFAICSLLIIVTAFLTYLLIFFSFDYLGFFFNNIDDYSWIIFIPFSVFLSASIQLFTYWYTRKKYFKVISYGRFIQSAFTSVTFILLGYLNKGTMGLILGSITGQFIFFMIIVVKILREDYKSFKDINKQIIKEELYKNRNFPYYSMPMGFLNSISMNLLIYVLNIFYSVKMVGLYAKANRVVNVPISLLTSAFTSVFYQNLSVTKRKLWLYKISYFSFLITGIIFMIPIIFWGESIFKFVLGDQWTNAGYIAKIIAPFIIFSFATSSVSNVYAVTKKNHIVLIWQLLYIVLALVIIYIFRYLSIYKLLFYFSLYGSFMYLLLAISGYYILKKGVKDEQFEK